MAAPPDHNDVTFEFDVVVEGFCAFPINVHVQQTAHETVAFHENGVPAKILAHVVEQDTFGANGKVLQTLPYALNYQLRFDPEESPADDRFGDAKPARGGRYAPGIGHCDECL